MDIIVDLNPSDVLILKSVIPVAFDTLSKLARSEKNFILVVPRL